MNWYFISQYFWFFIFYYLLVVILFIALAVRAGKYKFLIYAGLILFLISLIPILLQPILLIDRFYGAWTNFIIRATIFILILSISIISIFLHKSEIIKAVGVLLVSFQISILFLFFVNPIFFSIPTNVTRVHLRDNVYLLEEHIIDSDNWNSYEPGYLSKRKYLIFEDTKKIRSNTFSLDSVKIYDYKEDLFIIFKKYPSFYSEEILEFSLHPKVFDKYDYSPDFHNGKASLDLEGKKYINYEGVLLNN
jgi:hypothetical protein